MKTHRAQRGEPRVLVAGFERVAAPWVGGMWRAAHRILLVLAALIVPAIPVHAADAVPAVSDGDIHVVRNGNSFTVDAVMHAPVPVPLAWAVLTDFGHMAEFSPNLTTSEIVERGDSRLVVSQKGEVRYGIFSTRLESVREIHLVAQHEIRAHSLGGSVKHMESVMHLQAEEGGTRLQYHAEVEPDSWFPPLIGPALVRHESAEQFSALIREMIRRR